jgi:hypothetical protein
MARNAPIKQSTPKQAPKTTTPAVSVGTAAQAASLQTSAAVSSFTVSDTAANIGAAFDALNADTKLTAIAVTNGQPIPLSYTQYITDTSALALLPAGTTLTVSAVPEADAAAIQAAAAIASFAVTDTTTNVLAGLATLAAATKLSAITLTGATSLPVTYAQYQSDASTLDKLTPGDTMTVSAATAAAAAKLQGDTHVAGFTVSDTGMNIAAGLTALGAATKLTAITVSGGTTVPVTYTQYNAYTKTLALIASPATLVVSTVPVANAPTVQAAPKVSAFAISDTSTNIAAGFATFGTQTKLSAIAVSGATPLSITYAQYADYKTALTLLAAATPLTVTGATISNAATLQSAAGVTAFTITDTTANMLASLATLAADTKLSSIALSGATALAVTDTQYLADTATLDKLATGDTLTVSAATVAGATALQADTHVGSFAITDTAANVGNAIASLGGDTKLSAITLTGGTSISVTYAGYSAGTTTLAKLASGDTMAVTGVTAAAAATVAANARVNTLTVSDTLADIGTSIGALETLAASGKLTGITVTDSGQNLSLTAAQYSADQAAIKLMTGSFTITHPVINLIWDASVANAPAGFVAAVEDAAAYFDALITNPITVNIDVGYGEYDGKALPAGVLGDTQILNSDYITTAQFKSALSTLSGSSTVQSALTSLSSSGEPTSVWVEGGDAKAVGATAAYGTETDAAIGFALDPTGRIFNYSPTGPAVLGEVDFIGLTEAEIGHALGRVSSFGISSSLDLYRYSSPGTIGVPGASPTYFSINGGTTNLDNFATSLDYGDWAASAGNDAVAALIPTGTQNLFTSTDVTELNALGYGIAANAPSSAGVIPASAASFLNASSLTFIGSPLAVTMGSGTTTASAAIPPAAGIEEIAGFTYGTDKLILDLRDLSGSLEAFDTTVGGVHAIALAGSNDLTHGIVLLGMPTANTAANLLASHLTLSGSTATIA